jgi:DNA-binding response OmpR family regulator
VLLIEDDEAHAWFISRYLKQVENMRIALSHAATLADGLRLLASQPFDAVLLDLRLQIAILMKRCPASSRMP